MKSLAIIIASTLIISSCGQSSGESSKEIPKYEKTQNEASASDNFPVEVKEKNEGQYIAKLSPINVNVAGFITGAATLSRVKDELVGDVRFSGEALTSGILHEQNIHTGDRCPTAADDLNNDGFIDSVEGALVYDKVIIPLDGDLNSQRMGGGIFPVADEFGGYIYSQVASYEKFMKDLREIDINQEDHIVTLTGGEEFEFENKVVVIQGVSANAALPDTVATNNHFTNYQSLPVACGVFSRIHQVPGRSDVGSRDYPLPNSNEEDQVINDGATLPVPPRELPTPETVDDSNPPQGPEETSEPENYGEDD